MSMCMSYRIVPDLCNVTVCDVGWTATGIVCERITYRKVDPLLHTLRNSVNQSDVVIGSLPLGKCAWRRIECNGVIYQCILPTKDHLSVQPDDIIRVVHYKTGVLSWGSIYTRHVVGVVMSEVTWVYMWCGVWTWGSMSSSSYNYWQTVHRHFHWAAWYTGITVSDFSSGNHDSCSDKHKISTPGLDTAAAWTHLIYISLCNLI